MSRPVRSRSARPLLVAGTVALFALLVLFSAVFNRPAPVAQRAANPPAAPAPAPHFLDLSHQSAGALRTLVIASASEQLPGTSNDAGFLMANLRSGELPAATRAVVLSDSNCQPDDEGISHCLNDLQIGSSVITVQHHHNMQAVPCLSPGETVQIIALAAYQG